MSFTFDPALSTNVDLVRFHLGDTDEDGYYVENEMIEYWVDQGTVGSAVIACIKYILSQLSKPDFKLDWMSVTGMDKAREGYEKLLKQKQAEFGLRIYTPASTISQPYRADSDQDSDDYTYDGTAL